MKNFKVVLTRDYILKIKAQNEWQAKNFAEHFISRNINISDADEEKKKKFQIIDIDVAIGDTLGSTAWEEN